MTHTAQLRSSRWLRSTGLFVLSALVVLGAPSNLTAQIESSIAIWADPNIPLCEITDVPGERTLYVVHRFNPGTTAVRFKIASSTGITMTYLSETHYFASTVGNTQEGISVCYETCLMDNVVIAGMKYVAYGTSAQCSRLRVVPHPSAQTIEAIDCGFVATSAHGEDLTVSLIGSCGCPVTNSYPGAAQAFNCNAVATGNSTWGAIKALYRN